MGVTGEKEFAKSSRLIAEAISESAAASIILGGDTSDFAFSLKERNPKLKFSVASNGGVSALELMLGKKLPGLDILAEK